MNDPAIPSPAERQALNAALITSGTETGFWDDDGRPAPWPDDIDEWAPVSQPPGATEPQDPPF
ncbi:hypothetical protein [Catenuloplanes japonicus]|uniref:hypothetical protein n=1 Tax=Catenuloplanes japonicus TaxID=33876 RepID=UPI000527A349|nr:hypothetical protein [Catenuloplanes japonicus]